MNADHNPHTGFIWSACSQSAAVAKLLGTDTLEVTGVLISTVKSVNDYIPEALEDVDDMIESWYPDDVGDDEDEQYVSGEPMIDAFVRALSCCLCSERTVERSDPSYLDFKDVVVRILGRTSFSEPQRPNHDAVRDLIINVCLGRTFAHLHDGHFGITPPATEEGKTTNP
jgi:hypothetical protein